MRHGARPRGAKPGLAARTLSLRRRDRRPDCSAPKKKRGPSLATEPSKPRQRPTLPQGCPYSTIGPGELNFRVRDGNGCDPSGIATEKPELQQLRIEHGAYSKHFTLCSLRFTSTLNMQGLLRKAESVRSKKLVIKPHDLLVLVSLGCYHPYTPSLSTQ